MTTMVDSVGTTSWTYDMANRFTVEDGPWANDNVTNRWNTAGLRSTLSIQQPASYFNNTYSYDAAWRLTNITSGAGTFSYYYHSNLNTFVTPSQLIQRISLPNASYITNHFDSQARLTDTYLRNSSGTALNRHSYVYNNAHQRTKQTYQNGDYVNYLYDNAGQLYSARTYYSGGGEIVPQRYGYLYDAAWNLNKRTNNATVTTFSVNNLNQISSLGFQPHTYDSNGNLTMVDSALWIYDYDDENQLVLAQYLTSKKSEFYYDGKMRLRIKKDYNWNSTYSNWDLVDETRYLYDGMLIVQERSNSNTPLVTYSRGTDLSGDLDGAGGIGGLLSRSHGYSWGAGTWSTHHYYHADGNGNITAMVASNQVLSATYRYQPFGTTITSSGSMASANLMRFSSKLFHTYTDLYYYGYRFYHPNLQRWLNRDPIEEHGGINLYRFVENNPVSDFDPHGLTGFGSCMAQCMADHGWGLGIGAGAWGLGLPIPGSKRFVTPGSSPGTSIAGKIARCFPKTPLPFPVWTPTIGNPGAVSRFLPVVISRWLPWVGAVQVGSIAAGCASGCSSL